MSIEYFFFNAVKNQAGVPDRTYNAQDFTSYLDKIVGSGVFPNPATNLQVVASSGFNILVKAGSGWIEGHKMVNKTDYMLTLSPSDVLNDRIDRVIFFVDYSSRSMGITVLEGTPATTPTAPDITRNQTRIEYSLATIRIVKQSTAITQANITDTRPDSTVCGWVAGLIQQVDTSELYAQWEAAYQQYYNQTINWTQAQQLAFEEWFRDLTEELQIDTYIQEYKKDVALTSGDSQTILLDMTGYSYSAGDIIQVYINGLLGVAGTDYTVNTGVNPVTVTTALTIPAGITEDINIRVFKSLIGYSPINP